MVEEKYRIDRDGLEVKEPEEETPTELSPAEPEAEIDKEYKENFV